MATRRQSGQEPGSNSIRPASTPEQRENQLIALAVDLTERQLREGTASAQVITHYLKLGSSREKLEQERLSHEVGFLKIKGEALASEKRVESLYAEAISAFKAYSGNPDPEQPEEEDDFY